MQCVFDASEVDDDNEAAQGGVYGLLGTYHILHHHRMIRCERLYQMRMTMEVKRNG